MSWGEASTFYDGCSLALEGLGAGADVFPFSFSRSVSPSGNWGEDARSEKMDQREEGKRPGLGQSRVWNTGLELGKELGVELQRGG